MMQQEVYMLQTLLLHKEMYMIISQKNSTVLNGLLSRAWQKYIQTRKQSHQFANPMNGEGHTT